LLELRSTPVLALIRNIAFAYQAVLLNPFYREEQVLLSSLLPAITHTQGPYNRAFLCVDGSLTRLSSVSLAFTHYWANHHYDNTRSHLPLTLRGRSLKASHLWGSVLKQATSSPIAYRHTSERVCSTITVGVPALISFVLPVCACIFLLTCLFINLRRKLRQKRSKQLQALIPCPAPADFTFSERD
jgi:hypothetical protein